MSSAVRISGFSFARNADKLYYPLDACIRSVLPICDEFVIAVGRGDPDDRTREVVESIGDPKVRIIDTEWTDRDRLKGWVHSQQTNIALDACTGDWCFYLQADEVVHERDLQAIRSRCEQLAGDRSVDGLLFRYLHFWGDYDHYHVSHTAYPREIRIIRNNAGVRSWRSAQSFRRDGAKIAVAGVDADIYHYGWVRPPDLMVRKNREMTRTHHGKDAAERISGPPEASKPFDYGPLDRLAVFRGSHPAVMAPWIRRFDWRDQLQYSGAPRTLHRHDRLKYRLLTFVEQRILGGHMHLGAKGYRLVRR
jgi:glycosyltransferase involved in cell wall biosynthesis